MPNLFTSSSSIFGSRDTFTGQVVVDLRKYTSLLSSSERKSLAVTMPLQKAQFPVHDAEGRVLEDAESSGGTLTFSLRAQVNYYQIIRVFSIVDSDLLFAQAAPFTMSGWMQRKASGLFGAVDTSSVWVSLVDGVVRVHAGPMGLKV